MKRNVLILFVLSLLFIITGCEKIEDFFFVKFKLDNKTYSYTTGHSEKMHDDFFFNELVGATQDMTECITIDYKENNTGIYSSMDTIAVYINFNNKDFYVFSNWTTDTPYSGMGESFNLRITFENEEKIQGEFSGTLWHFTIPNNGEYEIVELVDGKFDLFKK